MRLRAHNNFQVLLKTQNTKTIALETNKQTNKQYNKTHEQLAKVVYKITHYDENLTIDYAYGNNELKAHHITF